MVRKLLVLYINFILFTTPSAGQRSSSDHTCGYLRSQYINATLQYKSGGCCGKPDSTIVLPEVDITGYRLPTMSRSNLTFNEHCSLYKGKLEDTDLINGTHLPITGYNTFGTCKYNNVTDKYGIVWCPMPGSFTFDGKCYSVAMFFALGQCYTQCTLKMTYQGQTETNFLRSATCDCSSPHEKHSFHMEFTLPPRAPDTGATVQLDIVKTCDKYDVDSCPSKCYNDTTSNKCTMPALTVSNGNDEFVLDTGSARSILRSCETVGLTHSTTNTTSSFVGGAQNEYPANGSTVLLGAKLIPFCNKNLPPGDSDGLIGMALGTDKTRALHAVMNNFPGKRRFVMDEAKGTVCIGSECEMRDDISTQKLIDICGKDKLCPPLVYPATIDPYSNKTVVLDSGSTYSRSLAIYAPNDACLAGYNDIEYLAIDYDTREVAYVLKPHSLCSEAI